MSTATIRTNRFAGTCEHCRTEVPAGQGHVYKTWPFKPADPWLVRCTDEDACKVRQATATQDAKAASTAKFEAEHARNLESYRIKRAKYGNSMGYITNAEQDAANREAARTCTVDIPKTLTFDDHDGWTFTLVRRTAKATGRSRVNIAHFDETGAQVDKYNLFDCTTEAEAIAHTLGWLRGKAMWSKHKDTPEWAILDQFVKSHRQFNE